jgi:hypothetical protein
VQDGERPIKRRRHESSDATRRERLAAGVLVPELMPTTIFRNDLRRLVREGAQLVEVLPREEYDDEHLPGALSIPLRDIDREAPRRLRRDVPVIVYCWDDP